MDQLSRNKPKQHIPATRMLQAIVGRGSFKKDNIKKAQLSIENVKNTDTEDFVAAHISQMGQVLQDLKNKKEGAEIIRTVIHSMVDFKANIGTFGNPVYVSLATLFFQWIESIEEIDTDAEDLLHWYFAVIHKMFVEDAFTEEQVKQITEELALASKRYYKKHPEITPARIIDNIDTYFGEDA